MDEDGVQPHIIPVSGLDGKDEDSRIDPLLARIACKSELQIQIT